MEYDEKLKPAKQSELLEAPGARAQAVDWPRALRAVQGNPKILTAIADAVLEEIPQLIDTLRAAAAGGDAAKLRLAAHTLKGAVRYFGAQAVYDQSAKLEELGRAGELEPAQALLDVLETEIAPVTSALADYLRAQRPEAGPKAQPGPDHPFPTREEPP